MIPKIIHYCWFGQNEMPKQYRQYIEGWKKICPDYEIIEWNEENYDVEQVAYTAQAAKAGKWSFVSDYLGFDVVYRYGGIYLDTDVELLQTLDHILENDAFFAIEENESGAEVAPGLGFGAKKNHPLLKQLRDMYNDLEFIKADGSLNTVAIPVYTTQLLGKIGFKRQDKLQKLGDVTIYPTTYFAPMDFLTGQINLSPETISIHHYSALWQTPTNLRHIEKMRRINRRFGKKWGMRINFWWRVWWALERRIKKLWGKSK